MPKAIPNIFSSVLKESRAKLGISQRELSRRVGIAPSYISEMEKGLRGAPSERILEKLAEELNLPIEEFYDVAALEKNHLPRGTADLFREQPEILTLLRDLSRTKLDDDQMLSFKQQLTRRFQEKAKRRTKKTKRNAEVILGTKAETLERLRPVLKQGIVLPVMKFSVLKWRQDPEHCLDQIQRSFGQSRHLVIRSSALAEDAVFESNAGKYHSVLNVSSSDRKQLLQAVERVVLSYGTEASAENQFFVQPQLEEVAMSGVAFTRDLDNLGPYYVINYDEVSQTTDSVTSGRSNQLKTFIKFRNFPTQRKKFKALFQAIEEIESVCGSDCLDIEFAVDRGGQVYIFQVRPIVRRGEDLPKTSQVGHYLYKIFMKADKINKPHPYLHGDRTILGVMPDWNPAEMIGVKPRPLALSLYKELITDKTWAHQRDNYGYKNLRSYPLIVTLIGHPYIDVRVSFNSFIPKEVPDELSRKLSNYYLQRLLDQPGHHDKVEFEIILSCFFFNLDGKLKKMAKAGFTPDEQTAIRKALRNLTNNILTQDGGMIVADLKRIEELQERQEKVLASGLSRLEKIYWLLEDCRRYGTLPFAGLARAGFIAVQMLRSMLETSFLTREEYDGFMASLNTVAKQMSAAARNQSKEAFLGKYGHLRPGTYDILSVRYRDGYDLYFGNKKEEDAPEAAKPAGFPESKIQALEALLKQEGIASSARDFVAFLKQAIEGREYAKFIFTKSVSEVLQLIKELTAFYGLSPEDASYLDIRTLMQLYATLDHRDLSVILHDEIARNREFYEITKLMKLPPLIVHPNDVFEFELEEGQPNFITLGRCRAEIIREENILTQSLDGKIVFIPSADPGYDWIFTRPIAGLVTMYGGANSHMAIRAAELRIPSVIGAGEKNYREWSRAFRLEIDCANQKVMVIQ